MDYEYEVKEVVNGEVLELNVYRDLDAPNPLEDDDGVLGTVIGSNRNYSFFTEAENIDKYQSWSEWRINELPKNVIILPVYAYSHGGITISTTPFSCPWDSGQLGFIYTTYEHIRFCYGVKRVTKKIIERATAELKEDVARLDTYLQGDIFGYELKIDNEVIDQCGGYLAYPSHKEMVSQMADNFPAAFDSLMLTLQKRT
jgi:hypothetical protein